MANTSLNIQQLTDYEGTPMYPYVTPECIKFMNKDTQTLDLEGDSLVESVFKSIETNLLDNSFNVADSSLNKYLLLAHSVKDDDPTIGVISKLGSLDPSWFTLNNGVISISNSGGLRQYITAPNINTTGYLYNDASNNHSWKTISIKDIDVSSLKSNPTDENETILTNGYVIKDPSGNLALANPAGVSIDTHNSDTERYFITGVNVSSTYSAIAPSGDSISLLKIATENMSVSSPTGIYFKACTLYQTSDESLKEFVDDIDVNLDNLALIKKGIFYWKDDPNKVLNIGVGANSVEALYPQIVDDINGIKTVSYEKLGVIALAAIDKLNAKIASLEKEIEMLKKTK